MGLEAVSLKVVMAGKKTLRACHQWVASAPLFPALTSECGLTRAAGHNEH